VAQSQNTQTLFAPINGGGVALTVPIPPHRAGVYTVNIRLKETGDYKVLVATDRMMPDRSNLRLASSEVMLHVEASNTVNTFTIADPVGEATYVTIRNLSSQDVTVLSYTILFDPM
jgi:hypothetical protein